ncbi:MAG: hypothetical protein V2A74_12980, partial [bacterium]
TAVGFIVVAAVPLWYLGIGEPKAAYILALIIWLCGGIGFFEWWACRRKLPHLKPEDDTFKVFFLRSVTPIATLLIFCVALLVFYLSLAGKFLEIFQQELLGPLVLLPVFLMIVLTITVFGVEWFVLYMISQAVLGFYLSDQLVGVRYLVRTVSIPLEGLEIYAQRGRSADIESLIFNHRARSFRLLSYRLWSEKHRLLKELCDWFEKRGIQPRAIEEIVPASRVRFCLEMLCVLAIFAGLVPLLQGLLAAAAFWYQWFLAGIYNSLFQLLVTVLPLLALVYLVGAAPPGRWICKLLGGSWLSTKPTPDSCRVSVARVGPPRRVPIAYLSDGIVSSRDEELALLIGRQEWRIARKDITALRRHGRFSLPFWPGVERFFGGYIELLWQSGNGVERRVAMISHEEGLFGSGRRYDNRLYDALHAWWKGTDPNLLKSIPRASRWAAPLMGLLFPAILIAATLVHNHLFFNYVLTGEMLPPKRIEPKWDHLSTYCFDVGPWQPGYVPMLEQSADWYGTLENPTSSKAVFVDPVTRDYHWAPFGIGFMETMPTPIGSTALLRTEFYPMKFSTYPWDSAHLDKHPPQIISAQTGRAKNLTSVPKAALMIGRTSRAIYRDEKIFVAWETDRFTSEITRKVPVIWLRDHQGSGWPEFDEALFSCEENGLTTVTRLRVSFPISRMGWIDVEKDEFHDLGKTQASSTDQPNFFPDGDSVLFNQTIIDLHTGNIRRVENWPAADPRKNFTFNPYMDIFASGEKLCLRTRTGTSDTLAMEVWEVDPETAICSLVEKFPNGRGLICADGDRWLIYDRDEDKKGRSVKLYDHKSGKEQVLFHRPDNIIHYHKLIAGKAKMVIFLRISDSELGGFVVKDLPW